MESRGDVLLNGALREVTSESVELLCFRAMKDLVWYLLAAAGEIGGCFSFWAWQRMQKSPLWTIPGVGALILFALALTRIDTSHAGRAFAAYGGIYILASLLWLWGVENTRPDHWDMLGAGVCLTGAGIILFGPRHG
jgi:small multidrug resistance family-3 protein